MNMNKSQNDNTNSSDNPWKTGAFATAGAVILLVAAGFTFAAFKDKSTSAEQPQTISKAAPRAAAPQAVAAAPAPTVVAQSRENCDQYRINTQRDTMKVVKDGAIGAAVGAGTGAAGGAIADGGKGAKKGAGIVAVIGAEDGGAMAMTGENDRIEQEQREYQDFLNRNR